MGIPATPAELCISGFCGGTDRVGFDGADYDGQVTSLSNTDCEIGVCTPTWLSVPPGLPGFSWAPRREDRGGEDPPGCPRKLLASAHFLSGLRLVR